MKKDTDEDETGPRLQTENSPDVWIGVIIIFTHKALIINDYVRF